ncbi:MAG: dihydropteridine reductase [Oscillospiraceae bacterium]|nr:dihydropteridine reductase [Oscillospiraceae bacterium]
MNNENAFSYTYNAEENQEVLNIRKKYMPQEKSPLDALKDLDAKVNRPANVFAYTYGSVSAIIMGAGMSLVMTDIGAVVGLASAMMPGIAIGIVGMGMALSTYPIYRKLLNRRKKKYAPQILQLSEKLINS